MPESRYKESPWATDHAILIIISEPLGLWFWPTYDPHFLPINHQDHEVLLGFWWFTEFLSVSSTFLFGEYPHSGCVFVLTVSCRLFGPVLIVKGWTKGSTVAGSLSILLKMCNTYFSQFYSKHLLHVLKHNTHHHCYDSNLPHGGFLTEGKPPVIIHFISRFSMKWTQQSPAMGISPYDSGNPHMLSSTSPIKSPPSATLAAPRGPRARPASAFAALAAAT